MTQDCYLWELERVVCRVEWREKNDPSMMVSVIVETTDPQWAIDRAWSWCRKASRPATKKDMRATKVKMLL